MMQLESQDWDELVKLLQDAEESLAVLSGGNNEEEVERSRRSIVSFHTTAAMLGLNDLEKVGLELENFLTGNVSPGETDSISPLGLAINSLIERMQTFRNGSGESAEFNFNEILEMLKPPQTEARPLIEAESLDADEADLDFTNLRELAKRWGCEFSVDPDGDSGARFSFTLTGSARTLKRLEKLFISSDPASTEPGKRVEEAGIENLIEKGKELVTALSSGDMDTAQSLLLKLADQQRESSGLYKQIGCLARGLHDSIRSFLSTLDPSLNEIVKDKIPDTGNRLEHILEMTEKAAITTLDHVENMQERLAGEKERISDLSGLLGGLRAIGDSSGKKLDQAAQTLNTIGSMIDENRVDLDVILTAQDYQDLSGQIILKVTQLLRDIEGKLVNLIRNFGVKTETVRQKESDQLYGPAHSGVENAVHSQDEVDSLLAEFGF
ncbi:MAG TPA: protein phosphatase CheZ [Syntrophobacteraceae bacterium]|nr:protein phosphatase CheZ [Syntrophobacteraceae bacterium]